MVKLIACIMAGNCEKTIKLCLKAVEPQVDEVVICYDTSSKDKTMDVIKAFEPSKELPIALTYREYKHDLSNKTANSDQRNHYLNYLKENHMDDWVLCLDADEVVDENLARIKDQLKQFEKENWHLISPRMIHFQSDLGHEDGTKEKHYVLNRLFKVTPSLFYPDGEHPVLQTKDTRVLPGVVCESFIVYHFAYAREMFYLKDRIDTHRAKSEIHTAGFLTDWYHQHISGTYPKREIDVTTLPKVIKDYFEINDDYFYFKNRNIEFKQVIDAAHWRDFFKPETALMVGDGKAIRTLACRFAGINAEGFDISEYAVQNNLGGFGESIFWKDDIVNRKVSLADEYDLVVIYDVLEHLDESDLPKALDNAYFTTRKFLLISVPMIGDPNLYNDKTHKIFWTRQQWEQAITNAGFKIIPTPNHFLFKHQLIVAEKNGNK
jgi:hypothetical protein